MRYTRTIACFDLKQIADSGQCFRMVTDSSSYITVSRGKRLHVSQEGEEVTFDCPEEDLPYWLNYFDCATDYAAVIAAVDPKDAYLTAAAQAGRGIRILRQDPWEMIITFVISQQKTIPNIRQLVEALCRRWGTPLVVDPAGQTCAGQACAGQTCAGQACAGQTSAENPPCAFAFPTPEQLSGASLEELLELKLGYRAKYIHRLAQDAAGGALDLERLITMEYGEAMEYLTGFYGIGKKVANCVCLFGLHHIEAFPVDTWIEKILMREYYSAKKYRRTPQNRLFDAILEDHFGKYGGYAGVLQQYIFYYERLNKNKIA